MVSASNHRKVLRRIRRIGALLRLFCRVLKASVPINPLALDNLEPSVAQVSNTASFYLGLKRRSLRLAKRQRQLIMSGVLGQRCSEPILKHHRRRSGRSNRLGCLLNLFANVASGGLLRLNTPSYRGCVGKRCGGCWTDGVSQDWLIFGSDVGGVAATLGRFASQGRCANRRQESASSPGS